ncbi:hypothetical protein EDE15_5028 [Edaphobacter aggregans]|uniref:Uncharacterized protein n=1 Tax=Edaphobacter aggregans TaxID=570835 RepID=A0A3R9PDN5_9BACT|nr:hypothetical protein EDE15_5028 [Edaphobacter aggregans]
MVHPFGLTPNPLVLKMQRPLLISSLVVNSVVALVNLGLFLNSFAARASDRGRRLRLQYAIGFTVAIMFLTAFLPIYRNPHGAFSQPLCWIAWGLLLWFTILGTNADRRHA